MGHAVQTDHGTDNRYQLLKLEQFNRAFWEEKVLLQASRNTNLFVSLRHSVNGDFCGHSRFVLWHENLTTFVS